MTRLTKSPRGALLDGPAPPRLRIAPNARANGWEDISDLAASLGMPLDEWQDQALEASMGERSDGRWASKFVGISAPRQNGKSQLIVARALAGVLLFGEKMIIISAHETDTAREVWKRLIDIIEANPTLEARVTGRMDAINREFLAFGKGADRQTIKLKARRRAGVRGFSADCLLLDEAQILDKGAWGSIVPTMSARPNPQIWLFGTPPTDEDDPFAFSRVRESSIAKKARHTWLEWAADADDDFDSPAVWAKANPAFGVRISEEACADDRAAMDNQQFAEERLGIWRINSHAAVFGVSEWKALGSEGPAAGVKPKALAVDMSHNRQISVAACWHTEDGGLFAEEVWAGTDTAAVLDWLKNRAGYRMPIVIDTASPAASLVPALRLGRTKVVTTSASDMAKACGLVFDMVKAGTLRHGDGDDQQHLTAAVAGARKRPIRDAGGWGWDRRDETVNIAPLVAFTLSVFGASSVRRQSPDDVSGRVTRKRTTRTSTRRAVVVKQ